MHSNIFNNNQIDLISENNEITIVFLTRVESFNVSNQHDISKAHRIISAIATLSSKQFKIIFRQNRPYQIVHTKAGFFRLRQESFV